MKTRSQTRKMTPAQAEEARQEADIARQREVATAAQTTAIRSLAAKRGAIHKKARRELFAHREASSQRAAESAAILAYRPGPFTNLFTADHIEVSSNIAANLTYTDLKSLQRAAEVEPIFQRNVSSLHAGQSCRDAANVTKHRRCDCYSRQVPSCTDHLHPCQGLALNLTTAQSHGPGFLVCSDCSKAGLRGHRMFQTYQIAAMCSTCSQSRDIPDSPFIQTTVAPPDLTSKLPLLARKPHVITAEVHCLPCLKSDRLAAENTSDVCDCLPRYLNKLVLCKDCRQEYETNYSAAVDQNIKDNDIRLWECGRHIFSHPRLSATPLHLPLWASTSCPGCGLNWPEVRESYAPARRTGSRLMIGDRWEDDEVPEGLVCICLYCHKQVSEEVNNAAAKSYGLS